MEVHAPPKPVAETMVPFLPFTERRLLGAIDEDKRQPENGAENGRDKGELHILLEPAPKQREHDVPTFLPVSFYRILPFRANQSLVIPKTARKKALAEARALKTGVLRSLRDP